MAAKLDLLVLGTGLLLIITYFARLGVGVIRARRAGWSGVAVGSWVTVSLIGLGCAVAGAVAGSRLVFALLPPGTTQIFNTLGQAAGALILSDLVAKVYNRWLAPPLRRWFSGEEAEQHAG